MLQVRDIMTAHVITLSPQWSVRDAMELLARHHVSGAPVIAGNRVVGLVSASDLLAFAASLSGVPTERDRRTSWDDDDEVVDDTTCADPDAPPTGTYFAELWDDAGADVASRIAVTDSPEWNALDAHEVSEAMTLAPLLTLSPAAPVEAAAILMRDRAIHRVLVIENDELCGILSALDIAGAVANGRM